MSLGVSTTPRPMSEASKDGAHPAALWARGRAFTPEQLDCTTAVVLKILDGKCKMGAGEKRAVTAVYQELYSRPESQQHLFDSSSHQLIAQALEGMDSSALREAIHALRLQAEVDIPKPVMKAYKAVLADGLFG